MTIQVTGILRDPTGTPMPFKEIRVIATQGSLLVLSDAHAIETTDENGLYDFPLEDGTYIIDVLYDDEAMIAGSSIVNTGTPTPVTLSELFLYTTPLDPQQVIDLQVEFQQLIDDLESAFDTETQEIRTQLVDGDATTLQTAQTFTNDRLGAQLAVITAQVVAGDASTLNQSTAYTDTAGNILAADITQVNADTVSVTQAFEASRDAQGNENALIRTEIAAGVSTAISISQASASTETGDLQVLLTGLLNAGDASILQQSGINAQSLNDATEAFLLDKILVSGAGSVAGYEAFTIASLGYFDGGTGLWVDGPLSSSFRAHTVSTSDGGYASLTDSMQTMAKPDGTLVVKGSMISDVNGRITGYRHSNDGVTTNFNIIADDFAVGHMSTDPTPVFIPDLSYDTINKILRMNGNAIIDGSLTASALVANSITTDLLAANAVEAGQIAADAVTGTEIHSESTITVGVLIVPAEFTMGVDSQVTSTYIYTGFIKTVQGSLTAMGSLSVNQTIRGEEIVSLYTQTHLFTGDDETWLWLENQPTSLDEIKLIIDGTPITFVRFAGAAWWANGVDVMFTKQGTSIIIEAEEGDIDVDNGKIAGVNGIDDGTGIGVDTLRFWAGQSVALAHAAPYRVDLNGNAWFNGDVHVGGIMEIGSSITGDDYVNIYGNNSAGTSNRFLGIQDGGLERVRWDYNGRLRIFDSLGEAIFDMDPANDIFTYKGTISADSIDSDVVATVAKSVPAYNNSSSSDFYVSLYDGTIAFSLSVAPRTLSLPIPIIGTFSATNSQSGNYTTSGLQVQINIDNTGWTTHFVQQWSSDSLGQTMLVNSIILPTAVVTLDSNAHTYAVRLLVEEISATDTETISWSAQTMLPLLFRQGSSIT